MFDLNQNDKLEEAYKTFFAVGGNSGDIDIGALAVTESKQIKNFIAFIFEPEMKVLPLNHACITKNGRTLPYVDQGGVLSVFDSDSCTSRHNLLIAAKQIVLKCFEKGVKEIAFLGDVSALRLAIWMCDCAPYEVKISNCNEIRVYQHILDLDQTKVRKDIEEAIKKGKKEG